MAWNRVTDLTADHEGLATVVERLQSIPEPLFESWLRDQQSQGDVSEATQAQINALFGGDGRLTLKAAPALLVGSEEFKRNSLLWSRWNRRFMMWDKLKALAGIEHLRRADGEKRLVIISRNGFSLPIRFVNEGTDMRVESTEDDLRLATRAADANVILDIIHTSGTDIRTSSWFQSSQNLSHLTGGLFTSLRTADEQLARIDDASRGGYLIGYVPTNSVMDGKYRRVNISVARRGVTVVHRRGYVAHATPPQVDPRSLMTRVRFNEAAAAGIDVSDLKVTAGAKAAAGSAGRYVEVELTIDPSNLTLTERNGRWEGSLDLMVLCGDRNRSVIGKLEQEMTLSMEPAIYQQALKTGIPYRTRIPVKGVPAFAKVMVYDYDSDRLGTVSVRLN
jgi:hypothetical protein